MRLSNRVIENQLQPRPRRFEVIDDKRPGLVLVTLPTGIRTWAIRWFADGKQYRYTLGRYPTISVDKARKLATSQLSEIAGGANPQLDRIAERTKKALGLDAAEKVAFAWGRYEAKHVNTKLKASTAREIKRIGKLHILPRIGKMKLGDVTGREIKALVDRVAASAPVGSNRTLAVLNAFYNHCIDQLWVGSNPCTGIKRATSEKNRKSRRILNERELKWLWQACDRVGYPWGQILKLAVITGARRGEVAGMLRDELDPVARLWSMPGTRTKNHRPHTVYISDAFRSVLKSTPKHKGRFVFSDHKNPPSGFSKGKARIAAEMDKLAKADFEPKPERWTIHDLRRTCASHMARLPGVSLATVSLCLNHWEEIGGLKEIYIVHDQAKATREAFKLWNDRLKQIVGG